MDNLQNIPILAQGDVTRCPTCGMPVRIVRRDGGYADHYEPIGSFAVDEMLKPVDEVTAAKLRELRKGKKTVALCGLSATSCSLAPFEEPKEDVEIWGLNEMHHFSWMKRADRWFQIHCTKSWKRDVAKRGIRGHYDWLKKNEWNIPIYMQYWNDEIPNVIAYPLHEVCDLVFANFRRGDEIIKYFTSTFAFYMGIAILEKFERIEVYGFEMNDDVEYVKQKACAEFWVGNAMGRGIEIYTPPNNQLLWSGLYGGHEMGEGW